MSGNPKAYSSIELSREEDIPEKKFTNFSLEKEESCSLIFDDNPMRMEPEDHLENWFQGHFSPPSLHTIKEEPSDIDYIYRTQTEKELTLNDHYEGVKKLLEKCRIVQQIIFSTSKEPIYKYNLGFETEESDNDDEKEEQSEMFNPLMEQTPENKIQFKEENFQNLEHLIKTEEDSSFGIKEGSGSTNEKKKATLITVSYPQRELPFINWIIELTSKCLYKPLNYQEKRKFLNILEKLNSMKKGICRTIISVSQNDHKCKYCGIKFETGRKLGGHISRKHPGNSFDYHMKKEMRRSKLCERNRRNYLKNLKEQNQ